MRRPVSSSFVQAMEEGLEWGRSQGRIGWDEGWGKVPGTFGMPSLIDKLEEEVGELLDELLEDQYDYGSVRKEAADVANIAMMIADLAGA